MKLYYKVLLVLFLLNITVFAQEWVNRINGTANSIDAANTVAVDTAGNTYTAGFVTNLITGKDLIVVKYNSAGNLIWSAQYSNGNLPATSDEAYAITIDASYNVYVGGYTTNSATGKDILLIKYNSAGIQQWVKTYSGSGGNFTDEAYAITIDAAGDCIIGGYSYTTSMGTELTVIKYNSAGAEQWIRKYNGSGTETDEAYAITIDATNSVIVTGRSKISSDMDYITIKYNSAGNQQWVQRYNGTGNSTDEAYAITIDASDNIFITGKSKNSINYDAVTISYNSTGTQRWLARFNRPGINDNDIAKDIDLSKEGSIIIAGSSNGVNAVNTEDYMLLKYDSATGTEEWARFYNGSTPNSIDIAYNVATTNSFIFITGSSRSTADPGSEDIVTLKYNYQGNLMQQTRYVNSGSDAGHSIGVRSNNDVFVAGYLTGSGTQLDLAEGKYDKGELIAIENISAEIPSGYSLHQNYPNPFNPSTNIRFEIPVKDMVTIKVFDILGKEIIVPVNEVLGAGTYVVSFSMKNATSGIYYYKITSGNFSETKKMILVK
jgi:uncharacterized delta-60 repeat protein